MRAPVLSLALSKLNYNLNGGLFLKKKDSKLYALNYAADYVGWQLWLKDIIHSIILYTSLLSITQVSRQVKKPSKPT
jgi:hypothetical protein